METYKTEIHVVCWGSDELDAAERAGKAISISKMETGMYVHCEQTSPIIKPRYVRTKKMKKYRTVFQIITQGLDEFEAAEKANELFDMSRMEDGTRVSWESTEHISCEKPLTSLVGSPR